MTQVLGATSITVHRDATGPSVGADGRQTPAARTEVEIRANVQPLTGDERELIEEGLRSSATHQLISRSAVYTERVVGGVRLAADFVVVDGVPADVRAVEPYGNVLVSYQAILVRRQEQ